MGTFFQKDEKKKRKEKVLRTCINRSQFRETNITRARTSTNTRTTRGFQELASSYDTVLPAEVV